jgi:hypothetical protein
MAELITLALPDLLVQQVRDLARLTDRRLEDLLVEWLDRASRDFALDALSDRQVLELCDLQMPVEQQERLSELLAGSREGELSPIEREELDELMQVYRRGLVRKAQALKLAVTRGLRPALG